MVHSMRGPFKKCSFFLSLFLSLPSFSLLQHHFKWHSPFGPFATASASSACLLRKNCWIKTKFENIFCTRPRLAPETLLLQTPLISKSSSELSRFYNNHFRVLKGHHLVKRWHQKFQVFYFFWDAETLILFFKWQSSLHNVLNGFQK